MINWLDILLGGILTFSVYGAFRNGLVKEITRLVALVVGLVGGMWFCADAGSYFQPYTANEQVAVFAGFLVILIGSLLLATPTAWLASKLLGASGMMGIDQVLGAAFGLLRGGLISSALLMALITFSPAAGSDGVVASSRLAPMVLNGARWVSAVAPVDLQTRFSAGFDRIRAIWVNDEPSKTVETFRKATVEPVSAR